MDRRDPHINQSSEQSNGDFSGNQAGQDQYIAGGHQYIAPPDPVYETEIYDKETVWKNRLAYLCDIATNLIPINNLFSLPSILLLAMLTLGLGYLSFSNSLFFLTFLSTIFLAAAYWINDEYSCPFCHEEFSIEISWFNILDSDRIEKEFYCKNDDCDYVDRDVYG